MARTTPWHFPTCEPETHGPLRAHVGRLGGDGPVVRLRPMRVARARRGLEVVLAHQPAHPLLRGAHPATRSFAQAFR